MNVAYFTVMTKEEFLLSPAVAITFANRVFPDVAWIAPLGVALSCLGSLNGICFGYARMPFIGARKNQLPKVSESASTLSRTFEAFQSYI